MATTNDITGDALVSRATTDNYRDNYDRIFRRGKGLQHLQAPCTGQEYLGCTEPLLGLPERELCKPELPTVLEQKDVT